VMSGRPDNPEAPSSSNFMWTVVSLYGDSPHFDSEYLIREFTVSMVTVN
jgi:hypothetical protein